MTRMIRTSPSLAARKSVVIPAAMDMTSTSSLSLPAIPSVAAAIFCGFTLKTTVEEAVTSAALSVVVRMPYFAWRYSSLSARMSAAMIVSGS